MRRPLRLVVAVSLLSLLLPFAQASAGKAAPVTVDAWIVAENGTKTGQGIRSPSAVGETYETSAQAPSRLIFDIVATPVGGRSDVTFLGGAGSPDFVIQYLSPGGVDITLTVTGRGYRVRGVSAGQLTRITMVVTLRASALGRNANLAVLAQTSGGRDMVAAYVTGA
ncbi:MAG: hypothetical protein ABI572_03165 [Actinomycetota bacterium]